jgi:hypothetical protein
MIDAELVKMARAAAKDLGVLPAPAVCDSGCGRPSVVHVRFPDSRLAMRLCAPHAQTLYETLTAHRSTWSPAPVPEGTTP